MTSDLISIYKKAFTLTKENIMIAQPLIIYLLVISITSGALYLQTNKTAFVIFLISNFFLSTAFFAGWFKVVKKTVEVSRVNYEKEEDKNAASMDTIKEFFPGVSEYFISVSAAFIIYFAIGVFIVFLGYKLGTAYLPSPDLNFNKLMAVSAQSPAEMQKFVMSLSMTQLKAINIWVMYIAGLSLLFNFITLFIFPALYNIEKKTFFTPFIALWKNITFIFRNFFGAAAVLICLACLNILVSMVNAVFSINIILTIIAYIIAFYYLTYCVVLVFLYYEEKK